MELWRHVEEEYIRDIYGRCDLEETCNEGYMDSCNLWEDNYFQPLFYHITRPYVENIVVGSQEPTNFKLAYSPVVGCYVDDFFI